MFRYLKANKNKITFLRISKFAYAEGQETSRDLLYLIWLFIIFMTELLYNIGNLLESLRLSVFEKYNLLSWALPNLFFSLAGQAKSVWFVFGIYNKI